MVQRVVECPKTWECGYCKKQIRQLDAARAHVLKEHFGEPTSYECVVCRWVRESDCYMQKPTSLASVQNLLVKQTLEGIKILN